MGTLYIDRKNIHVKLDGNALAFYANSIREGMVPITPLKRVIVIGNITFDTPVLHKLSGDNISVVFLSGRRLKFCGMLHGRLHNNGLLRVRQYEKSLSMFTEEFSLDIVQRKVQSQLNLLNEALPQRPDLRFPLTTAINTLARIVDSLKTFNKDVQIEKSINSKFEILNSKLPSLRGYEGSAAAAYFSAYTTMFPESLNFENRNRRPPEDPVNAMLSLCYTLLHYELVREIETIGLDPTIGFYHQFEYGRESLACDMVEIFRPHVDRLVWNIFRDRVFADRDFSYDNERPGCYLKKGGRQRFYPLYEEWAKETRPQFVETVRSLARKIMNGQEIFSNEPDYEL